MGNKSVNLWKQPEVKPQKEVVPPGKKRVRIERYNMWLLVDEEQDEQEAIDNFLKRYKPYA